ncbi:helix-turn-helix domain-containing protein [Ruminococcaceae bacterium OttesenSCG-928-D13]|nr:helix-turn-helix domain-containing protein [Ruminococcaceae bacterium OttesenSCG-928-D13]
MKYDPKEFKALPTVMNKEQLRKVCHISKRTALYLLQSGLIPCTTTGKKTRCYSIKKSDVIAYLKDREADPCKYAAPNNWYTGRNKKPVYTHAIRHLPKDKATRRQLETYYARALADHSDVLDVGDICHFTGYNRRAVGGWCRKGQLRCITSTPKYLIPKCFFLEYLCSDTYNNKIRKSEKHLEAIWAVYNEN